MKAAVLTAPRSIEIQNKARPQINEYEVLIKLQYCGICTLEQRLYTGDRTIYFPIIPGHEASGVVVECGEKVNVESKPGDPVALDLVNRCGECYYCRAGQSNQCLNRYKKGQRILGGFAEYIAVHSKQVFPLSNSLNLADAAFAEPVACCIHSLKKVRISLAEDLLILGAGAMGQMHIQVAQCLGARVFVSDPDIKRLELARTFGAVVINPSKESLVDVIKDHTEGRGVDACVITSPAHEALNSAIDNLSNTGRINIYTSYDDTPELPIDANTLHRTEQLITGSEGRTEFDFLQAVRLLCNGQINVAPLISTYTTFPTITEGMEAALGCNTYRVLLKHEA